MRALIAARPLSLPEKWTPCMTWRLCDVYSGKPISLSPLSSDSAGCPHWMKRWRNCTFLQHVRSSHPGRIHSQIRTRLAL